LSIIIGNPCQDKNVCSLPSPPLSPRGRGEDEGAFYGCYGKKMLSGKSTDLIKGWLWVILFSVGVNLTDSAEEG